MLEMSERESSDVWRNQPPAHKAPGRVEAKELRSIQQKSVSRSSSGGTLTGGLTEFKLMHRKRDKQDSRHSAEDQYSQNLDAREEMPAAQCKRQKEM